MEWNTASVTALVGLVGAIAGLLGAFLAKGRPWFTDWLKYSSTDRKERRRIEATGYGETIARLDDRVRTLESEIIKLRNELDIERGKHFNCQLEQTKLRAEVEALKHQLEHQCREDE